MVAQKRLLNLTKMISTQLFRKIVLALPETEENPHFDRAAFRIIGRRIFVTMHEPSQTVNIPLTPEEQSHFCESDEMAVYPVPNKWGEKGWTTFDLRRVERETLEAALHCGYNAVVNSPKKKPRRK